MPSAPRWAPGTSVIPATPSWLIHTPTEEFLTLTPNEPSTSDEHPHAPETVEGTADVASGEPFSAGQQPDLGAPEAVEGTPDAALAEPATGARSDLGAPEAAEGATDIAFTEPTTTGERPHPRAPEAGESASDAAPDEFSASGGRSDLRVPEAGEGASDVGSGGSSTVGGHPDSRASEGVVGTSGMACEGPAGAGERLRLRASKAGDGAEVAGLGWVEEEVLEALEGEGVLVGVGAETGGVVGVVGEGAVVEWLVGLLEGVGFRVVRGDESASVGEGVWAVVSVAEWLPDRRWAAVEEEVVRAGVAWHRVYGEGRRWYVGPFWTGEGDAGYGDVRVRRLAASPWPEQLAAYWRWLDDGGRPEPDPVGAPGAVAAAAFVVADLVALRAGRVPPGRNVQVGIDLTEGVVRRHPVLPVPVGLMREVPA